MIKRALRIGTVLSAVVGLTACSNRVVSERPWFSEDSTVGAPHLKPGVWVMGADKDCRFDERQPTERWPTCASEYVVRANDTLSVGWSEAPGQGRTYDWYSDPYLLAGGDPMISQKPGCDDLSAVHRVNEDGSPVLSEEPRAYCYSAVQPTGFDAAGQIVGILTWPVFCGPWPSKQQSKRSGRNVTTAPFAGLHVVVENCTADSEAALRAAARASKAVALSNKFGPTAAHWVRDGYH